ncbi:MAG TPA: hypothetical protein DIT04_12945 [Dysgonomonas sp.]|nr:hypothetical protein [Dysgonomonas sp.]
MSSAYGFRRKIREYPYSTIFAILAVIGGYSFLLFMDHSWGDEHFSACPFKFITGIPCPGCGMGRATLALFRGDIQQSLYYNILCIPLTIAVFIGLCWLIFDLFKGKDSFFDTINQPLKKKYLIILFTVIGITWMLNIYHGV